DPLSDEHRPSCEGCSLCVDRCPVGAFAETVSVDIAGREQTFRRIDRRRCDWAKRYSLIAESGTAHLGWDLTIEPPEQITPDALADALRQLPGIERHRPCNAELCVLACPHTGGGRNSKWLTRRRRSRSGQRSEGCFSAWPWWL
ncbi:MAG: hypothetical protein ACP5JJ_19560, partial [Anaerolineae bacterium]